MMDHRDTYATRNLESSDYGRSKRITWLGIVMGAAFVVLCAALVVGIAVAVSLVLGRL